MKLSMEKLRGPLRNKKHGTNSCSLLPTPTGSKLGSSEETTDNGPLISDVPDLGRISLELRQLLGRLTRGDNKVRTELVDKFFKPSPNKEKLSNQSKLY